VNKPNLGIGLQVLSDQRLVVKLPLPPTSGAGLWNEDKDVFIKKYLIQINGEYYYNTGDYARVDEDNYLYILGRDDDCLKIGMNQLKIGATELESNINQHEAIFESVAVEYPTVEFNRLVVLAFSKDRSEAMNIKLKKDLIEMYGKDAEIFKLYWVNGFPKNITGKLLRGLVKKIVCKQEYSIPSNIENQTVVENLIKQLEEDPVLN
jgi:propionyl-CoA synthetase